MEKITHKGKKGVFYTDKEYQEIQNRILAQKKLINEFKELVKL